ncbi:SPOR domain-containing protein [Inquilinus sp. CAU 1745]|uniref:SPOR domain-containing protein n=1 Tax=Inquilinus sp. CAU 1745 TaxID=3140369 RepID=UPI00325B57BB
MSDYHSDYPDAPEVPDPLLDEAPRRGSGYRRALILGLVLLAFAAFGALIWYAYATSQSPVAAGEVPLIQADPSPTRIRPEQPGGLEVPHQDRLVLRSIDPDAPTPVVEQLLPPPEQPMEVPEPPPPAATPAPAVQPAPPPAEDDLQLALRPRGEAIPPAAETAPEEPTVETPPQPVPEPEPPATPVPETAPAAEPAPVAPSSQGGVHIQMAAVRTQEAARGEWARLQGEFPDLLGGLQLRVQEADLGERGIFYRVQAGPLDEARAEQVCGGLKAQNTDCILVR